MHHCSVVGLKLQTFLQNGTGRSEEEWRLLGCYAMWLL
jgi:hypothetical protein